MIRKATTVMMIMMLSIMVQAKSVITEFKVEGQCGECKERIELALDKPGISYAQWDVKTKMIKIRYNNKKYSEDEIHKMIADLGYATSKFPANETKEAQLPKCCQPGGHEH